MHGRRLDMSKYSGEELRDHLIEMILTPGREEAKYSEHPASCAAVESR